MKAFPRADGKFNSSKADELGMDLRDYFAAHALQGLLTTISYEDTTVPNSEIVEVSYNFADLMMEARKI
jgi:hypothetical protein